MNAYVCFRRLRWIALLMAVPAALAFLSSGGQAYADKIITKDGQSFEGIIIEENPHYVKLDVQGTMIPVPRERIERIVTQTQEENLETLLSEATTALSRGEIADTRALLEQARVLTPQTPQLREQFEELDERVAEIERKGGTLEERRKRARRLLEEAQEAFDKIRTEEGNRLLILALKTDPSFERAHEQIEDYLEQPGPDLQLAAEYFTEIMWPDQLRPDSPVIELLPAVYADLAERFRTARDVYKIGHYAEQMRKIYKAFSENPNWLDYARRSEKRLLKIPVNQLLANLVSQNVAEGEYAYALVKLKDWASPSDSVLLGQLYVRCYVGLRQFGKAEELLGRLKRMYPNQSQFLRQ